MKNCKTYIDSNHDTMTEYINDINEKTNKTINEINTNVSNLILNSKNEITKKLEKKLFLSMIIK